MRKIMIAAALAAAASPAVAQVTVGDTGGLVNVTITDVNVLNDSLNQNELELLSRNNVAVPISIQVPIGIAANFCGISANVLVADIRDGDDTVTCTARNGSRALGQQVLRQTVRGNK